jgi:catechol 2,3-dioxygenase-like lactoylglutathione lyase family enzyme
LIAFIVNAQYLVRLAELKLGGFKHLA